MAVSRVTAMGENCLGPSGLASHTPNAVLRCLTAE